MNFIDHCCVWKLRNYRSELKFDEELSLALVNVLSLMMNMKLFWIHLQITQIANSSVYR